MYTKQSSLSFLELLKGKQYAERKAMEALMAARAAGKFKGEHIGSLYGLGLGVLASLAANHSIHEEAAHKLQQGINMLGSAEGAATVGSLDSAGKLLGIPVNDLKSLVLGGYAGKRIGKSTGGAVGQLKVLVDKDPSSTISNIKKILKDPVRY